MGIAFWIGAGMLLIGRLIEFVNDRGVFRSVTFRHENAPDHTVASARNFRPLPSRYVHALYLALGLQWVGASLLAVAGLAWLIS
jgi:hypothetical protein